MKIIDKAKAFFGRAKDWVVALPKKVWEFIKRHSMMLIFIVGTSSWIYFFPRLDPNNSPHLFFLLVVAFLLGTMRDHEVWWRQRVKLEAELKFLKDFVSGPNYKPATKKSAKKK